MDAEIVLNCQVWVDFDGFVAEGADIHFFVLFLVGWAVMRFNGGVICTEDPVAVFAFDGEPIFLMAGVDFAVLSYVLIEHWLINLKNI